MAAPIPPLTPKTKLRNEITEVYRQKQSESAMCNKLAGRVLRLHQEAAQTESQRIGLETVLLFDAAKKITAHGRGKEEAYCQYLGVLTGQYLEKKGDIQQLAQSIFGPDDSAEKREYLQQVATMEQLIQHLPRSAENI